MRQPAIAATLAFLFVQGAHAAADPKKILRTTIEAQDAGFDPALTANYYSGKIMETVGESLLSYDYLARPSKVIPLVAEAMPLIEDDGKTYTFKIRQGVYFAPDPVFKGVKRELTAEDFVFSFKRFMDPKVRSQWRFLFEGKIVGLDALSKAAETSGKFDYDAKVEGLQAIDRYTLKIKLNATDYNFLYIMAMPSCIATAREVVEAYKDDLGAHLVGTNAYMLKEYVRGHKIILEANPYYRGFKWDFKDGGEPGDAQVVAEMQGKMMPQIGRVEITVVEEEHSKFLSYAKGETDMVTRIGNIAESWQDGKSLKPELLALGMRRNDTVDAETTYELFNHKSKVIGGMSKDRIALRRAMIMSYDIDEEARVIRKGQAIPNHMPIPRGVIGYNPNYRSANAYNPEAANKLLDKFGFKKGPDGWRRNPDGSPLLITRTSEATAVNAEYDKLWNKSFTNIGLKLKINKGNFADNLKAAKDCQLEMWGSAWSADYPDGENFLQLLYGPNSGQSNNGCYNSPVFNKLYEMAAKMPNSPQRDKLYWLMARQFDYDGVWRVGISRVRSTLTQAGVLGYKKHPMLHAEFKFMDIDLATREAAYKKAAAAEKAKP
jgi:ABC-type transport system substrate-binding protein